ncbi:virulence-related protein [Tissierella carlieri]|uniref:Virulence-related protein n=1 Tax=Tissierella carlieri TaxID=689904 RepID=A0ABT1S781_9FIRM|nr:virulence-related protein [Tissierella carlieri]MCQ4922207.1 virulence-related protein [Tissierella carlieri]
MDRKEIVKTLSEHLGIKSKYLGAPSFAYKVGDFTVDREGKILNMAGDKVELEDILNIEEESTENKVTAIGTSFPLEGYDGRSLKNLLNMIYSRQPLIKKTFNLEENIVEKDLINKINEADIETIEDFLEFPNTENLKGISFDDEKITFNFIKDEVKVSMDFLSLLIKKSKELKFASAKPINTDNEKYAFRTWLIRLGMIGDEYKATRKVLLQNLSGNGAFRKLGENHEA